MANWNNTILRCSDTAALKEIMKGNPFNYPNSPHLGQTDKEPFVNEKGEVHLNSRWTAGYKEIKKMSKENPGLTFLATYQMEDEYYNSDYNIKYKNGREKFIDVKPNYAYSPNECENAREKVKSFDSLFKKAIELFARMDIPKSKKDQNIDWVTEVTVMVQDDHYKIEFRKGFVWAPHNIEIVNCWIKKDPNCNIHAAYPENFVNLIHNDFEAQEKKRMESLDKAIKKMRVNNPILDNGIIR